MVSTLELSQPIKPCRVQRTWLEIIQSCRIMSNPCKNHRQTGNDATIAPSHGSSNGYTLVTAGVKYQTKSSTQTGSTKSVESGKSKNSFELLQCNDDEEEDMLVKENQEKDDTRMSPIL